MSDNHTAEKEIVRFTSNNGSKRHLPPWMLPKVGATATPTSKSENAENNCSLEEGPLATATDLTANAGSALKKKAGTGHKRETLRRKSHSFAKCEVKRRSKLIQQDASGDNNITQRDKKKIDSSKDTVQKTYLKKSQIVEDPKRGSCDVNSVQAFSDDEMELTIEDMMAIAEDYVKDYENKEQKEASCSQRESVKQFPVTSESGSSLDFHREGKRSSAPAREGLYDSNLNKTAELVATGTSQTGDPAQDMLDLFLGPLLKKPLEEEKNKSIVEGMEFTHEVTRKSQEEFAGEETVPLMKKKSSLKDKVAMFLD